jgi:hypothetical protein
MPLNICDFSFLPHFPTVFSNAKYFAYDAFLTKKCIPVSRWQRCISSLDLLLVRCFAATIKKIHDVDFVERRTLAPSTELEIAASKLPTMAVAPYRPPAGNLRRRSALAPFYRPSACPPTSFPRLVLIWRYYITLDGSGSNQQRFQ